MAHPAHRRESGRSTCCTFRWQRTGRQAWFSVGQRGTARRQRVAGSHGWACCSCAWHSRAWRLPGPVVPASAPATAIPFVCDASWTGRGVSLPPFPQLHALLRSKCPTISTAGHTAILHSPLRSLYHQCLASPAACSRRTSSTFTHSSCQPSTGGAAASCAGADQPPLAVMATLRSRSRPATAAAPATVQRPRTAAARSAPSPSGRPEGDSRGTSSSSSKTSWSSVLPPTLQRLAQQPGPSPDAAASMVAAMTGIPPDTWRAVARSPLAAYSEFVDMVAVVQAQAEVSALGSGAASSSAAPSASSSFSSAATGTPAAGRSARPATAAWRQNQLRPGRRPMASSRSEAANARAGQLAKMLFEAHAARPAAKQRTDLQRVHVWFAARRSDFSGHVLALARKRMHEGGRQPQARSRPRGRATATAAAASTASTGVVAATAPASPQQTPEPSSSRPRTAAHPPGLRRPSPHIPSASAPSSPPPRSPSASPSPSPEPGQAPALRPTTARSHSLKALSSTRGRMQAASAAAQGSERRAGAAAADADEEDEFAALFPRDPADEEEGSNAADDEAAFAALPVAVPRASSASPSANLLHDDAQEQESRRRSPASPLPSQQPSARAPTSASVSTRPASRRAAARDNSERLQRPTLSATLPLFSSTPEGSSTVVLLPATNTPHNAFISSPARRMLSARVRTRSSPASVALTGAPPAYRAVTTSATTATTTAITPTSSPSPPRPATAAAGAARPLTALPFTARNVLDAEYLAFPSTEAAEQVLQRSGLGPDSPPRHSSAAVATSSFPPPLVPRLPGESPEKYALRVQTVLSAVDRVTEDMGKGGLPSSAGSVPPSRAGGRRPLGTSRSSPHSRPRTAAATSRDPNYNVHFRRPATATGPSSSSSSRKSRGGPDMSSPNVSGGGGGGVFWRSLADFACLEVHCEFCSIHHSTASL